MVIVIFFFCPGLYHKTHIQRVYREIRMNCTIYVQNSQHKGCPHGVMVKLLVYGIIVSKSELQLHYYVHICTFGKGMNPFILLSMG